MALIEDESFDQELDSITEEQPKETPVAEQTQEVVVETVIPDKYKGKSLDEIVKMHQEAEKMIGRQAQEVHEVRSLADQLLKRQLEADKYGTS